MFYFRFVVRDFVYDEEELAASKNEISRLTSDKKKLFVSRLSSIQLVLQNIYSPFVKLEMGEDA